MTRSGIDNSTLIAKILWDASPEGRAVRLETILNEMRINGEDYDVGHYRRRVEMARAALDRGHIAEARACLAHAEHALTELDYLNDSDRLRGVKTRAAASDGGNQRASMEKSKSAAVIREMQRLLGEKPKGSISWAATVARNNGFGTSAGANKQAWYRWKKKL